jgi:CBS domain-containing protein
MNITLEDLLPMDQQIRTIRLYESAASALNIMHQHRYGQVPAVGEDEQFLDKVVTFESVLQAIQSFHAFPETLQVRDVAKTIRSYRPDADLLTTLEDIHRDDFALIADDSKLVGIITTADLALFFREYAQDLMEIEGIESQLKGAIRALYVDAASDLSSAIAKASDRSAQIRKKIPSAIGAYLKKIGVAHEDQNQEEEALRDVEKVLGLQASPKTFDELTFDELITVLFSHPKSPRLSQSKDVSEVRRLLERVRNVRNTLAHFRRELSPEERRTIQFAAGWLENNLPAEPAEAATVTPITQVETHFQPEEPDLRPQGSYANLATFLQIQSESTNSRTLTFSQIEDILGKELPRSASEYRAWWANDPTKPQSAAWLDEGWRTSAISMSDRRLTFSRTNDRENAYISFFAKVNSRLARGSGMQWKIPSSQGQNWHVLASLDKSRPDAATIVASFARKRRFRIELYIDYGDKDVNKRLFDSLFFQRHQIEGRLGEPLEWERLDQKRASRIAIYTKAQVLVDVDNLSLIDWAVRRAEQFRSIFENFFPSR